MFAARRPLPIARVLAGLPILALLVAPTASAYSSSPSICDDGPGSLSAMYASLHGRGESGSQGFSLGASQPMFGSDPITITLSKVGGGTFNGLLLFGVGSNGLHVGTWTFPSGFGALSCTGGASATLGHTNATARSLPFSFTWTPPSDPTLTFVTFHAIVMQSTVGSWCILDTLQLSSAVTSVTGPDPVRALELAPGLPNPFGHATQIDYALPVASFARLAVLDVSGRIVRHLASGEQSAGQHRVSWDAADDSGRGVASGLYIITLEAAGARRARRVVYLGGMP
ncbi:MAG TPA: FlgD immunoglobulin-like domain containing protein [Candidatus Acidoferrales bacterium]|nr:FlgD immunoglobulin-like domain containing protein [Candidatus Acidoferrales bacterium]